MSLIIKKVSIIVAILISPTLLGISAIEYCRLFKIPISPSLIFDTWFIKNFVYLFIVLLILIIIGFLSLLISDLKKERGKILIAIVFIIGIVMGFRLSEKYIQCFTDRYESIIIHSTEWSPNFLDSNFKQVQMGYSKEDVIRIVGQPLSNFKISNNEVVLTYSQIGNYFSRAQKGYHQRAIILRDDKVVEIYRRYITTETNPFGRPLKKKRKIGGIKGW